MKKEKEEKEEIIEENKFNFTNKIGIVLIFLAIVTGGIIFLSEYEFGLISLLVPIFLLILGGWLIKRRDNLW